MLAVHVDRLKKSWYVPESRDQIVPQPNVVPKEILHQKGQKYLVRHSFGSDDARGATIIDKWMKPVDIPTELLTTWHLIHRKDGGVRLRQSAQGSTHNNVVSDDDDPSNDDVIAHEEVTPGAPESCDVPAINHGQGDPAPFAPGHLLGVAKRVAATKDCEVESNSGLRRSSRVRGRVDYRELNEHGFN